MKRGELGRIGEKIAVGFLKKKGYRIRETNFRCRAGEIDIVAEKKGHLVFVEVRTKMSLEFGKPEESVTVAKKEKLVNTALTYLASHESVPDSWRIDFIAVEIDQRGKVKRLELIENAVS
jgi:putative endonuclease